MSNRCDPHDDCVRSVLVCSKCKSLFKYGHAPLNDGCGLNGTYSTHVVLRPGTHVVRLPDHLSDEVAAPVNCALATVSGRALSISCFPLLACKLYALLCAL